MASALRRGLLKLQKNTNAKPMAAATKANTKSSPGLKTKSANHPKAGGSVKFGNKPMPTGADRSPLSAPAPKPQTSRQRYFTKTLTGKKAPKGNSGLSGAVKAQLMP